MALFLVIGLLSLNVLGTASPRAQGAVGILGGPVAAADGAGEVQVALTAEPILDTAGGSQDAALAGVGAFSETGLLSSVQGPSNIQNRPNVSQAGHSEGDAGASIDTKSYFLLPTQGFNWGKLHSHNAVDISNSCGTQVVAAAGGLVEDLSLDSWSGGYGHYVMLVHPNGLKTRYAHLGEVAVSLGGYVPQGGAIGLMGRTGDATGCHLHFEVEGGANPFAR